MVRYCKSQGRCCRMLKYNADGEAWPNILPVGDWMESGLRSRHERMGTEDVALPSAFIAL